MNTSKIINCVLGVVIGVALCVIWRQHTMLSTRAGAIDRLTAANSRLESQIKALTRQPKNDSWTSQLGRSGVDVNSNEATSELSKRAEAQLIARHEANKATNAARNIEQAHAAPEMQDAYLGQLKSALPVSYASLYHRLGLSAEQIKQFESIMANRFLTVSDFELAARTSRVTRDMAAYETLYSEIIRPTENELSQLLGDAGYRQYILHEQRVPVQSLTESLNGKAAGAAAPFSYEQMNLLSEVLLANSNAAIGASGDGVRYLVMGKSASSVVGLVDVDWKTTMSQLATVFPEKQLKFLEAIANEAAAKKSAGDLYKKLRAQGTNTGAGARASSGR